MRPHTIDAMMRLAGRQDTAVTVNHAGTPEATVVVQIGRAVVYLHSMETADRFGLQHSFLITAACELYVLFFALWGSRPGLGASDRA